MMDSDHDDDMQAAEPDGLVDADSLASFSVSATASDNSSQASGKPSVILPGCMPTYPFNGVQYILPNFIGKKCLFKKKFLPMYRPINLATPEQDF